MAIYGTYDTVWNGWVNVASTAATTTTVWGNWNNATTTNATVTTIGPWIYWADAGTTATANVTWANWNGDLYVAPKRTPEQIAADEERARVARAEWEERQARERADREQAVQRAETLLHEHLNDRQRRALKVRGVFRVQAMSGRWYEVGRGHHGKLTELGRRGKPVNRLCVYAVGGLPDADQMLAQKLYLESAEEALRKVAYITPVLAPA